MCRDDAKAGDICRAWELFVFIVLSTEEEPASGRSGERLLKEVSSREDSRPTYHSSKQGKEEIFKTVKKNSLL